MINVCKPFGSNLEYLSAMVEYLVLLAQSRKAENQISGLLSRAPRKTAQLQEEHPEKYEKLHDGARLKALRRKLQAAEDLLQARVQETFKVGKIRLPLEELSRRHDLDRFEKLVLATLLVLDMDPETNRDRQLIGHKTGVFSRNHAFRDVSTVFLYKNVHKVHDDDSLSVPVAF